MESGFCQASVDYSVSFSLILSSVYCDMPLDTFISKYPSFLVPSLVEWPSSLLPFMTGGVDRLHVRHPDIDGLTNFTEFSYMLGGFSPHTVILVVSSLTSSFPL